MFLKFKQIVMAIALCCLSGASYATMDILDSVEFFDLEMPMRCSVESASAKTLSSSVVIHPQDFLVRLVSQTDPLPRYQVNSFSARKQPLEVLLQNLLQEAGIRVQKEKAEFPVLSVSSLKGELSNVVEEIAAQAGVFYTYNASKKTLLLKHEADMQIQVPHDRSVAMAVIDAMAGAKLDPIITDWEKYQITMRASRMDLNKARYLMAKFMQDQYILSAEVSLYELYPNHPQIRWQRLLDIFGKTRFASSLAGVSGNLLVLQSGVNVGELVSKAMTMYRVEPIAQGQMVVPSGWSVHFDMGQCAFNRPYDGFKLILNSNVLNRTQSKNTLVLDSKEGEITHFDFSNMLNQEAAVIGIPVPNKNGAELLLTIRFKFINLIKKGE